MRDDIDFKGVDRESDFWLIYSVTVINSNQHSNEVFLRVTNHTRQAEKNLLGRLGFEAK